MFKVTLSILFTYYAPEYCIGVVARIGSHNTMSWERRAIRIRQTVVSVINIEKGIDENSRFSSYTKAREKELINPANKSLSPLRTMK